MSMGGCQEELYIRNREQENMQRHGSVKTIYMTDARIRYTVVGPERRLKRRF